MSWLPLTAESFLVVSTDTFWWGRRASKRPGQRFEKGLTAPMALDSCDGTIGIARSKRRLEQIACSSIMPLVRRIREQGGVSWGCIVSQLEAKLDPTPLVRGTCKPHVNEQAPALCSGRINILPTMLVNISALQ